MVQFTPNKIIIEIVSASIFFRFKFIKINSLKKKLLYLSDFYLLMRQSNTAKNILNTKDFLILLNRPIKSRNNAKTKRRRLATAII
jgi:hypothetical protein